MAENAAREAAAGSRNSAPGDPHCCVVGGGPAGMMLGLLLAQAGLRVTVLEKHADFLRDFRGDTIHPSTLEIMHELGLLDAFLHLPHQEAVKLVGQIGERRLTIARFSGLPTRCRFIAFMPQWDFLDFIAAEARRRPAFRLLMRCEANGLIEENGRIVGVRAKGPAGEVAVRARLVVAADGRHSAMRAAAGLAIDALGAPMDVLWFSLPRRDGDPSESVGRFEAGRILILIERGAHWQCGFVIPKGSFARMQERGIESFRTEIIRLIPFAADRIEAIGDWEQVKLLTVGVDRLRRWWRPGLLAIGDAAHTMSPVGGVGINLAIQDAVAAANLLATPLREGRLTDADLARVQRRRELPARMTQRLQLLIQRRVIGRVLGRAQALTPPLPLRILAATPFLQRLVGRLVGLGVRPEHVAASLRAPPAG